MTEVQSPFLPGTNIQYAWDSTSLGMLKTCPRLYQYIMIEGWTSGEEKIHLRFGIEFHVALQEYEMLRAEGIKYEAALHKVVANLIDRTYNRDPEAGPLGPWAPDQSTKAGNYKNRDSLLRTVIWYLDHYKNDPAKTIILQGGKPAVELSFRFELDWGPEYSVDPDPIPGTPSNLMNYILCGHLDKGALFNESPFVLDHKTAMSTLGDYWFDQFNPHNQMSLYTLAGKVVLDAPVKGVIIDGVQVGIEIGSRFVRGFTYRTPDQLDEWLTDLRVHLQLAETYATANYWPMNDMSCDKYGGCTFREICSKSPSSREKFLKSHFTKLEPEARWNPLKPR